MSIIKDVRRKKPITDLLRTFLLNSIKADSCNIVKRNDIFMDILGSSYKTQMLFTRLSHFDIFELVSRLGWASQI